MNINEKVLLYPHWSTMCRNIKTSNGHIIPWVTELRYLGTYIVGGRTFKCSTTHAKRSFHRAISAIFGKIVRLASKEVILELLINKCMPCLLYRLECYTLPKSSLRSLDFVVVRFLMKLFKTVNKEIIYECCSYFKFPLPSELLDKRRVKF